MQLILHGKHTICKSNKPHECESKMIDQINGSGFIKIGQKLIELIGKSDFSTAHVPSFFS
jgi:hypothetical protein